MRGALLIGVLIACWAIQPVVPVGAQETESPKGMSAIAILEGLTSHDPAQCDRATIEIEIMDSATGENLGREILKAGVREAQRVLRAVGMADNDNAVYPAAVALESESDEVRDGALEALIALTPGHVATAGIQPFRGSRLKALREMIDSSSFVKELCDGIKRDEKGRMIRPVEKSMRLMILLDRLFGAEAMGMLINRLADVMLGDPPADGIERTQAERKARQEERQAAAVWCEAIWIQDPAIAFNYSALWAYEDRQEAVSKLRKSIRELKDKPIHAVKKEWGNIARYGDYLAHIYLGGGADYIQENQYAAIVRTKWWKGEEVGLAGSEYNVAIQELKVSGRRYRRLKAELREWWFKYRAETKAE